MTMCRTTFSLTSLRLLVLTVLSTAVFKPASAQHTPSLNDPIPKPDCDSSLDTSIRYSGSSKRVYVESGGGSTRGGCATLSEIWGSLNGQGPLYAVDATSGDISDGQTGTWLLTEDLYIEDGITLQVHGTSVGGDADELRLLSTSDTFINLRAQGGSLDFLFTKVFSWDTSSNSPDEDEDDGRSYISALSQVLAGDSCATSDMGEARMDIEDSEIGYLGYHDSESYGLTWKVRGFCSDKSNPEVFDDVNVYGNIYNSDIHHNNFGVYTYGHQQGDWRNNEMHDNSGYGFDPHDDSDFLTIHDNTVYNNGLHGIIASRRCNSVSIQGNEVYGGGETSAGIFLHRSSDNAIVKDNHVHGNGDAGMALLESFGAEISGNTFEDNKYGVRLSVGCGNNVFSNNVISGSSQFTVYTYEGTNLPEVTDSGRSQDNVFSDNKITGGQNTINLRQADGTQFIDNLFSNVTTITFEDVGDTLMKGNSGLDSADLDIKNTCFDAASDSGYEPLC